MRAIYTICTPNFMGYSISMFNSIKEFNQGLEFFLIVFRPMLEIEDKDIPNRVNIIYIDEMTIDADVQRFNKRYPLNKVCFTIRPKCAEYILRNFKEVEDLVYFDSDILIFNSLEKIWQDLENHNIILTPHLILPLNEDKERMELRMLSRNGVYNSGFFAVKNSTESLNFLNWWYNRLSDFGLLGDQLWLNFAPCYFPSLLSSNSYGLNVAFYNIPNRNIKYIKESNIYRVNDKEELIFFHFVKYNPFRKPNLISTARLKPQNLTFKNHPELVPIFKKYRDSLLKVDVKKYNKYQYKPKTNNWIKTKIIEYKNQSIRILYKLIFEIVDL